MLSQVGYLWHYMQLRNLSENDIAVVGETIDACRVRFEPHRLYEEQLDWPLRGDWRLILNSDTLP